MTFIELAKLMPVAASTDGSEAFDLTLLIAPAAALLGVLVAQAISVLTDRRRRTAEHLKDARTSAETLLKTFQTYRDLIAPARSVTKTNPTEFDADEWDKVEGEASRAVAILTGKGQHRQTVTLFIKALNLGDRLAREGYGLTSSAHRDYYVLADLGFETIAAWLRYERIPRRIRRHARRLRRDIYWYDLEWRARDESERSGKYPQSGIVRRAWRSSVRWLRKKFRPVLLFLKKIWGALFRP